jgi:multidrug efflux pump subunit AcrB/ABC-type multidrug transport system ATPase subunit
MLFIAITMLGYISYKKLKTELYPIPEMPTMVVLVNTRINVDPAYMEQQAIIPLEGAIGQLEGVDEIESSASNRSGTIIITYKTNVNLKYAYLRLQEKINTAKVDLPDVFIVNVAKVNTNSLANEFMHLQVLGDGGEDRIRNIVDKEITPELQNIDGIASVNVFGGSSKSVEININADVAKMYNLTANRISYLLSKGEVERTYVGKVYDSKLGFVVNVSSEYAQISDIKNVVVSQSGPILLKDIADISFDTQEATSYSRVNGKDVVTLLLVNDNAENIIALSHKTKNTIEQLNQELASVNIEILVESDTAETMEKNIDQIIWLAVIGGLLAVVILWYFLQNIRLVTAVTLSIPISVFAAFNFFYGYGITINSLTLIGMALAIGMLIDNSVVVLENIYRLSAMGKSATEAVVQGTKEVWKSIFAATLTTICVFMPFLFSSSFVIKLYGKQIGVSIVATLSLSFIAAILLVPMIAHFFLTKQSKKTELVFQKITIRNRFVQVYVLLLKAAMRNPITTILSGIFTFFVVLLLVLSQNTNNLSEVESNEIEVYVTMPSGSSLTSTDELMAKFETDLLEIEEQETISSKIEEETGIVTLHLKDDFEKINDKQLSDVKSRVQGIMQKYDDIADLDFEQSTSSERFGTSGAQRSSKQMESMMGMGTKEESVVIRGEDYELMSQVATDLSYYLEEMDEVSKVRSSQASDRPEVHLDFDNDLMERNSIKLSSVSSELASFKKEMESGYKFKQDNEEYEIVIKLDTVQEINPNTMNDLSALEIENSEGVSYELQTISRIVYSSGISRISRMNQQKEITLTLRLETAYNEDKDLQDAARAAIDELVSQIPIPADVSVEVIHEEDNFAELYVIIGIAIVLIFMVLASVFESLSTPFVLLFSIPLAGIGSLIALYITNNSIQNMNSLMGFIILLGVVVNNGIILIDYSKILQKRGFRRNRALMTAGISRLRPIFITAITTIVAMMPLALGHSEYVGAIGAPFAITVIGGLVFSTILTLVFIPAFYSGLENALAWFSSLKKWIQGLQLVLFLVFGFVIFTQLNSLIWQIISAIILVISVPALVWFVLNSLKRAKENVIPFDDDIIIKIQNLVKVYDRDGRFAREWKGGLAIQEHFEADEVPKKLRDLKSLSWQIPILGFILYMALFYLSSGFWKFTLLFVAYLQVQSMFSPILKMGLANQRKRLYKIVNKTLFLFYWFAPVVVGIYLFFFNKNLGGSIVITLLWYLGLWIDFVSFKIHKSGVNINRLSGRFIKARRLFYLFVLAIPVIGKKRHPFKALKGVSLEIGKGMFGLLGPNGAGKSTLMRIICGIYEQSYGKVWFNGIDSQEKREELQGLIGYLPQEFGMYENMTAWDYLNYQSILKKITDKAVREDRVEKVLRSVHMWDQKDKTIGSYSGGMKQRIGIAQVLLHLPRILVVDEPTAGLDPRERIRFRNLLVELSRTRIVIFSTHIIEDISSSCNQLAVLKEGAVEYVGSPMAMAEIAKGHVWTVSVPAAEFESYASNMKVIHHLRDGEQIRIRILAEEKPHEFAELTEPNLEDAYLWLQKRNVN